MLVKAALLFACVYVCSAHLCMLSPPQRTPLLNINTPGSDSCILLQEPCGKTKPSAEKLFLVGGSNFTVVLQKNLDHFVSATPGYWSISIGSGQSLTFKEVFQTPDTSAPSLSLITANITIPDNGGTKLEHMVIQARYVTKNPKAPPVFYQCADVMVMKKNKY